MCDTHQCSVFVELPDLLSFPLHLQKQPLLFHLKVSSFLRRHAVLHLPD